MESVFAQAGAAQRFNTWLRCGLDGQLLRR